MSIANEISRIKAAKESLKTAINARGGNLSNELLDKYADAVNGLYCGPDLSGVTVTADKLLEGITAVDSEGVMITGAIPVVAASSDGETVTVPAGFHEENKNFSINKAVDLSFVTAGAGDIVAGKTGADANGNPLQGTLENVSMQAADNVITIPRGYSEGETLTLPEARVNTLSGKYQITKGYNKYLREFNITSNSPVFYRCASVDSSSKTWSGYKAVLSDGSYSFETTKTTNLQYASVVPAVGAIYTADALARINYLYTAAASGGAYVSAPLNLDYSVTVNNVSGSLESGKNGNLYFSGGMTQDYALTFNGSSYLNMPGVTTDLLTGDFTIEFGASLLGPDRRMGVLAATSDYYIGIDTKDGKYNLWVGDGSSWSIHADWDCGEYYGGGTIALKNATAQHLAIVRQGTSWKLYVDGKLSVEAVSDVTIGKDRDLRLGRWGNGEYSTYGKVERFNIHKEALSQAQINSIAQSYISSGSSSSNSLVVRDKDTHLFTNGQDSKVFKQYDGWAIAGILDVVQPVFMTGVILVAEDEYSCRWTLPGYGNGSPVSFEYNGKTYYYSAYYADLGTPKNLCGRVYLDAVGAAAAAIELLDRYFGNYSVDFDENCNLFVYRAGLSGVNGKYCIDAAFGGESVYRNGSYYMTLRENGGYWVICSDSDPDMPLYAACKYDENTGEYVPTENILGPWISMMGSQPPPRVLEGDWGAFGL